MQSSLTVPRYHNILIHASASAHACDELARHRHRGLMVREGADAHPSPRGMSDAACRAIRAAYPLSGRLSRMCSSRSCLAGDIRGRAHQEIFGAQVHREQRDFPQVSGAAQQRHDAIDAGGHAAMRRGAVLEGAVHAAQPFYPQSLLHADGPQGVLHATSLGIFEHRLPSGLATFRAGKFLCGYDGAVDSTERAITIKTWVMVSSLPSRLPMCASALRSLRRWRKPPKGFNFVAGCCSFPKSSARSSRE